MVDELAITNDIWRKWDEQKIKPPMAWMELRKKVEEYVKAGKDPYTLQTEFVYAEDWQKDLNMLPWANPEPDAVVDLKELPTFAEWLLSAVKRVWKTKQSESHWEWLIEPTEKGVLFGLRGVSRPHELFPAAVIQQMERSGEGTVGYLPTTLYFVSEEESAQARDILYRNGVNYIEVKTSSIQVADADYVLELLASQGFDTSRIQVEKFLS